MVPEIYLTVEEGGLVIAYEDFDRLQDYLVQVDREHEFLTSCPNVEFRAL